MQVRTPNRTRLQKSSLAVKSTHLVPVKSLISIRAYRHNGNRLLHVVQAAKEKDIFHVNVQVINADQNGA